MKEKNGHVYLELTEKDAQNAIAAQNSAIIWKTSYQSIKQAAKFELDHILKEGNEVRLLIVVDFSVKYGLKLMVQGIDPEYTFGKLAQSRLLTIEKLKQERIWQKNKNTLMPIAIKTIAVIASKESAGYKDFDNHLIENQFKYVFSTTLFNVSVQGINSATEICKVFEKLRTGKTKFDLVVLIRGGGSKHDLLEFDNFEIAKEISLCTVPVLTGIGHFIDESISDLSAYHSLKTPTAVADFILLKNREFELQINKLFDSVRQKSKQMISSLTNGLTVYKNELFSNTKMLSFGCYKNLTELNHSIGKMAYNQSHEESKKIVELNFILESNNPEVILQKGYSLTYKDTILLSKSKSIVEGDELKTVYYNGILTSTVNKIWEPKN